jgi:hypothetical protein
MATAPTGAAGGTPKKESNRIRRENWKREIRDRHADAEGGSADMQLKGKMLVNSPAL